MSSFGIAHADIANQALDSIGWINEIGDLQDGSREARVILRNYAPTVEEISRAAHWNFCRRQAQLTLLQDATQQSLPPVGTGTPGMGLWIYEYAWPIDCLKARYVPVTGSINSPVPTGNIQTQPPNVPPTTLPSPWPVARTIPAPFLVSQDLVPTLSGAITNWNQLPDLEGVQGAAYTQQTVILTNQQNASMVYTSLVDQPSVWDPLFRQAVIQVLAAKCATPLWMRKEPKLAIPMRDQCIASAKKALDAARVADGNESPANTNHEAAWIRGRMSGGRGGYGSGNGSGYDGPGYLFSGWEASPFPDGSAY
jgi:hypothetical protein